MQCYVPCLSFVYKERYLGTGLEKGLVRDYMNLVIRCYDTIDDSFCIFIVGLIIEYCLEVVWRRQEMEIFSGVFQFLGYGLNFYNKIANF